MFGAYNVVAHAERGQAMKSFQPWKMTFHETIVMIAVGLSLALMSPGARAQSYLFNQAGLTTGNGPVGVIVADFNHDHRLDLAVTNVDDNTVSVFLGARNGGFTPKVDYATGVSPAALVSADFRGDGKADLAVVNEYDTGAPGTVSILLGNGDGTFQGHVDYPVGNYPVGIVAADFNGDGKLDLAVVNDTDSTVSILFGNGDGTFQSQTLVLVGTEPTSLGSGDLNGDGKVDLITSNVGAGTVTVLLNKGNGSFTRVDSSTGILAPDFSALAVGDYNRDRKLDVAISSMSRGLFLLLGNGDGSFQPPVAIPSSIPDNIHFLLAGDFNHDGKLDLVEEGVAGVVFVLLGNGDGTFRQAVFSFLGVDVTATSLASADLNGDGLPDLVAVSGSLQVLLGKGDGTFAAPAIVRLDQNADGSDAAIAADFNGDGKLDLAVAEVDFPHGLISVELGKGDGTFEKPIVSPIIGAGINNQGKYGDRRDVSPCTRPTNKSQAFQVQASARTQRTTQDKQWDRGPSRSRRPAPAHVKPRRSQSLYQLRVVVVQLYVLYNCHCGNSDRHVRDFGGRRRAAGKSGSCPTDARSNSGGSRLGPLGSWERLVGHVQAQGNWHQGSVPAIGRLHRDSHSHG
jgi:hypothetical protein